MLEQLGNGPARSGIPDSRGVAGSGHNPFTVRAEMWDFDSGLMANRFADGAPGPKIPHPCGITRCCYDHPELTVRTELPVTGHEADRHRLSQSFAGSRIPDAYDSVVWVLPSLSVKNQDVNRLKTVACSGFLRGTELSDQNTGSSTFPVELGSGIW